jgi:hypothetical protein
MPTFRHPIGGWFAVTAARDSALVLSHFAANINLDATDLFRPRLSALIARITAEMLLLAASQCFRAR